MTLKTFIKKRAYLVWHVKDLADLSHEAIVEAILNYGDFDDFNQLMKLLGKRNVATIFKKQLKNKRGNYSPKIKNYFQLYFKKHAA